MEIKQLEQDFPVWLSDVLQVLYRAEHGDEKAEISVPCGDCNLCCSNNRVELSEEEMNRPVIAKSAIQDVSTLPPVWVLARDDRQECTHLGPIGCRIHEDRPASCRVFDCRKRIIANMADPFTLAMAEQWDMTRWQTEENEIFISAIQSAAAQYHKDDPKANISVITSFAITHFQLFLGACYLKLKESDGD